MPGGGGSALIVGGGISGLSLAHYLIRGGRSGGQIRLVEAAQRTGGWIRTEQVELGRHGTVAYECGPRSLNRIRGGMTIELCAQLGLADSVIPASSEAKRRYVVGMDGQMQEMPSTIMGMLRSPLTRSMIPWLVRDLILPKRIPDRDISMNEFFSQRIGPDATSLLVSALSAGIYAGDPARLSMQSCLPSLIGMAQQSGSLTRGLCQTAMTKPVQSQAQQSPEMLSSLARINKRLGPAPIYTLEGGLSTLTGALERHLQPLIDIQTDCKVLSLCPRTLTVQTSDGNQRQYDHIYWTGSASSLASALSTKSATDDADIRSLQAALGQVQYASVACVTLVWTQAAVSAPLGFGVLVPSVVKNVPPVLGITFDSVTFPTPVSKDTTVMTVMIGGDRHPDLARAPESDLVELAHDAVRHLLGIPQKADYTAVNLARDAIPQFYVGHSQVIEKVAAGAARLHPHLHLVGTAVSGVAINDCIRNGSEMGHQVSDQDPVSGQSNVFTVK